MKRKIKRRLLIILGVCGWFIGVALVASLCSINDTELIVNQILPIVFLMLAVALIVTLLSIIVTVIGEAFGKKEYQKEKFSPIDKNNEAYYREILENNTPLILSFVDNFGISISSVIAELLYLKKKNIIDLKNDEIIVLQDDNLELNEIHKFILKSINRKGKYDLYQEALQDIVAKTAEELQIVTKVSPEGKNNKKVKIKAFLFSSIIFFTIICIFGFIANGEYLLAFEALSIPTVIVAIAFYGAYTYKYEKSNQLVPYIRTEKGEELNEKLEGLKVYLKDYSLLNKKEANAIELWEDYLLYSVMFGQNKNIIEEYTKYIDEKN